jgi:23S rRNA (cytosine1962-C5)-methyltransferase
MIKLTLKPGKDEAIRRFHPWVFSGAIKKIYGEPKEGDFLEVYSNSDEFLGIGHYQIGSITVRIFSFENIEPDKKFWKSKIAEAYNYRKKLNLVNNENTNVYRLVFAEGDGLPGLILDYYNGTVVMQAHSVGMYLLRMMFSEVLQEIYGESLKAVFSKSSETLPKMAKLEAKDEYLFGGLSENIVVENGNKFIIDWETGQKTGFFVDQRENRELLAKYSSEKDVLNTFSYSGGFSVYALKAGAKTVHSVDSSKKAIELTERNLEANGFHIIENKCITSDTLEYLNRTENKYDLIVLDPPAYAKHNDARHNAIQGYKRLNAAAISKIKPGGILFTFSCSQVIDRSLFNSTVISAAITTGRKVRIMHQLSQPPDHPISAYHPEGQYLKGLVLFVE